MSNLHEYLKELEKNNPRKKEAERFAILLCLLFAAFMYVSLGYISYEKYGEFNPDLLFRKNTEKQNMPINNN